MPIRFSCSFRSICIKISGAHIRYPSADVQISGYCQFVLHNCHPSVFIHTFSEKSDSIHPSWIRNVTCPLPISQISVPVGKEMVSEGLLCRCWHSQNFEAETRIDILITLLMVLPFSGKLPAFKQHDHRNLMLFRAICNSYNLVLQRLDALWYPLFRNLFRAPVFNICIVLPFGESFISTEICTRSYLR